MSNGCQTTSESHSNVLEPDPKRIKLLSINNGEESPFDIHEPIKPLSKKQLRRLLKRERWLKYKPEKRAKEKERRKQRRAEARLQNVEIVRPRKMLKESTMAKSSCSIRVAIDLSFDDLMNDKALSKCVKQVGHCYSLNRRAQNPMQLYITSFNGKTKERMSKNVGYENWDVNFKCESYVDIFKKEDIVYLCSESDRVLPALNDDKVYIIGGLVDHNAHKTACFTVPPTPSTAPFPRGVAGKKIHSKLSSNNAMFGLTYQLAKEKNINHGHLPLEEYLKMNSRKVLTIDHVFEILLGVSEGLSWKEAFLRVLPARKGAVEKSTDDEAPADDAVV